MDLEYCLTPASHLVCEVIHIGHQADASAAEKLNNWLHHKGQYLGRTFKTKWKHLPLLQFPFPFTWKEFLYTGSHGEMEEGIFEIQPCTHGAFLEPFPDNSDVLYSEVNLMNKLIEFLQIQDRSPLVRIPFLFRYSEV